MSIRPLTPLPNNQWRFLKKIRLVNSPSEGNSFTIGYLLYQRPFSSNYRMKEVPEEQKDIDYHMDNQSRFPSDRVDQCILQAVKARFPNAIVWNDTIVFNSDQESIAIHQNRIKEPAWLSVTPNPTDFNFFRNSGQIFNGWRKEINIYGDYTRQSIQNLSFSNYYNLNEVSILTELDAVEFL